MLIRIIKKEPYNGIVFKVIRQIYNTGCSECGFTFQGEDRIEFVWDIQCWVIDQGLMTRKQKIYKWIMSKL